MSVPPDLIGDTLCHYQTMPSFQDFFVYENQQPPPNVPFSIQNDDHEYVLESNFSYPSIYIDTKHSEALLVESNGDDYTYENYHSVSTSGQIGPVLPEPKISSLYLNPHDFTEDTNPGTPNSLSISFPSKKEILANANRRLRRKWPNGKTIRYKFKDSFKKLVSKVSKKLPLSKEEVRSKSKNEMSSTINTLEGDQLAVSVQENPEAGLLSLDNTMSEDVNSNKTPKECSSSPSALATKLQTLIEDIPNWFDESIFEQIPSELTIDDVADKLFGSAEDNFGQGSGQDYLNVEPNYHSEFISSEPTTWNETNFTNQTFDVFQAQGNVSTFIKFYFT